VSDRLNELRRQRALQKEHLDSLDREIAALEAAAPPAPGAPPPLLTTGAAAGDSEAEAILDEYRQASMSIEKRTKFGCVLYFAIVVGVLALLVAAMHFFAKAGPRH